MSEKENLTQKYIYEAFLQILNKTHYDEISVCEICTKAGVSRMSFYRNFESKEDLTFKGIKHIMSGIETKLSELKTINTFSIIEELFTAAKKYKDALISLQNSKVAKTLTEIVSQELQNNSPVDYFNRASKYIPILFFSAITSVLFSWLKNGAEETPEEMSRIINSLLNIETIDINCRKNETNQN